MVIGVFASRQIVTHDLHTREEPNVGEEATAMDEQGGERMSLRPSTAEDLAFVDA